MFNVPEPARLSEILNSIEDVDPALVDYVSLDAIVVAVSRGEGSYYLYLADPAKVMKIRRESKLVTFKGGIIMVDLASEGPVGVHIIFKKEKA